MKKTIKALWLLLIAATIFTSCSFGNSAAEETTKETAAEKSKKNDICKQLFSKSDTKVDVYKFEVADGKWIYRSWTKESDSGRNESINVNFTYTDGKPDLDKKFEIIHQIKYTKDIPGSVVEKLKNEGYKHYTDTHWYKETSDKDKIKEIAAMDATSNSEDLAKYKNFTEFEDAIYTATHYIPENGNTNLITSLKTNSDKNKYWWQKVSTGTNNTYLMADE